MSSGYALHPDAYKDIDGLWDYIGQDNPTAADRVVHELFDAFDRLASSPNMGHRRPDLTSRPLRFWPVRDYLIAYAPDRQPLWVVAVLHGGRRPRVLASLLRSRQ